MIMNTTKNNSNIVNNMVVFAGGYDGEMIAIINACREAGVEVVDNHLGWGASASAYAEEIAKAVSEGKVPVLVELTLDIEVPSISIIVDHHNEYAGKPASIIQILDLLGVEPSREQQLIAANDNGYIPAMLALGATAEEVAKVRYADRAAQGITPEQEIEAERAIAAAEVVNGVTIVRMAHSKTATVCDRLFDPEKEQRLLILSGDGESNFFGNGELCKLLQGDKTGKTPEGWDIYSNFGGWIGGNLPISGFWGGYGDQKAVLDYVVNFFAK
ncbi:MAG: hypothetical protein IKC10_03820 [Alphaproteobacteria bacterium]|nr:hypothetical protein [Alphaproteobacteria bacterium]